MALIAVGWASAQDGVSSDRTAEGYRIGARDKLAINVLELAELQTEVLVDSAGRLRLPHIGEIQAAGLTESELAAEIDRRLEASVLRRASVDVQVLEFRSRAVTVAGAVARPGEYGFGGSWRLLDALTAAGGLDAQAASIHVSRRAENGLGASLTIPARELISGETSRYNLPVMAGDIVTVEAARKTRIFVLGEAASAGPMEFDAGERVTLLYAIARMGGLSERASPKITIRRSTPEGAVEEREVDFRRILRGKDPDVELRDGDILRIKESFF
jgi:polysaccharide export outer membrane protein